MPAALTESRWPEGTLRATGVSRSYAGVRALQDVTLELHRHEVVGLIGPNGAGKTTLVNVMSGFDFPTAGRIELDIAQNANRRHFFLDGPNGPADEVVRIKCLASGIVA